MTLKVALVSADASPNIGGIASCVKNIADNLCDFGDMEITTVTLTSGPLEAGVLRWPSFGKGLLATPAKGFTAMLERDFDIIHIFNIHTPLALVALGADMPRVVSPAWHGKSENGLRNLVWNLVRPFARHRIQGSFVQAFSTAEAKLLERDFSITPSVITQGATLRVRNNIVPNSVLTVSRLVSEKRVERLIETISQHPTATLTVVGDGAEIDSLRNLANQKSPGRVLFTGRVSDETLDSLWSSTAVYASASEYESFGISVAEAMVSGIPTVCSDIPSHREMGANCVANSNKSWLEGLNVALNSNTTPCMGISTWSEYSEEVRDLYLKASNSTSFASIHG